jgi:class 3 adenylate cyclase/tetratricopeptide (TPR) repeat protein
MQESNEVLATLSAYLPELAKRGLGSEPRTTRQVGHLDAGVLLADISGFTALTERLARLGPEGAEQLSRMLEVSFGRLQELIASHGGDIVADAGDALLACWPDHDRVHGARLAAQTARAVRDELEGFDAGRGVRLSIKCSVGAGELSALVLGGVGGRWVHLVDGPAVAQLARCNPLARPGDIVVSPEAVRDLGSAVRLEHDLGAARLIAIEDELTPRRIRSAALTSDALPALRGYVLPPVAERVEAGQFEWLSEFRTVSNVFIGLGAVDYRSADGVDRLQDLVVRIQRVLEHSEGLLLRVHADDKGLTLLITFGMPNWRHEDDAARAAMTALQAEDAIRATGLRGNIGVTTGLVYAGDIAAGERRFYTVLGRPVNLAARLMTAADGGILCDGETARRGGRRARFDALEPLALKGISEPVPVSRVRHRDAVPATNGARAGTLVGRRTELAILERAAEAARDGDRMTVLLEGDAGIGKSRLVARAAEHARASGMQVLAAVADPIDRTVPYLAWRGVVLDLLGWSTVEHESLERQREHVEQRLRRPGVSELAPLLNVVLPIELADTEATRGLTGDARAQQTREVLTRLIADAARSRPALVIVEDAHWLDSLSWALTAELSQRVEPLALIVAMRPADDSPPPPYAQIAADPRTTRLVLDELAHDDMLALVRARVGMEELPPAVEALLRERAGGHPLYAQELAYALRDAGALSDGPGPQNPGTARAVLEHIRLPDTIEGVVTSRIDRLSAPEQLSLKVGAVIGRVFPYRLLHDVHPVPADLPQLPAQLEHFDKLALVHPQTDQPDHAYGFRHAILRDVAYDLLTFAQRRRMHRVVAEWYERHMAPGGRQQGILAHHWRHAVSDGDPPEVISRAIVHLHRAAEQALASSAHAEAAEHLVAAEQPISWLPPGRERDALELQSRSLLGYALMNVRGYGDPEVEGAYRRARELSIGAPQSPELGPALYGLFSFYASRAEYGSASEVARELTQLDDPAATLVGDNSLGLSSVLRGDLESGAAACQRSHRAADRDPDIGVLQQYGGDFRGYPRAWLSIAQCLLGRPDDAWRTFEEALDITRWHPYTHCFVLCFAGVPQLRRDVDAVRRHAGDLRALASRYGFVMLGAVAGIFLGWADAVDRRAEDAVGQIEESIVVPRFVALDSFMPWYLALFAEAQAAAGRIDQALATVEEGVALVARAGANFYEPELHRLAAELLAAAGERTAAEDRLEHATRLARAQGARWWELRIATEHCRLVGRSPEAIRRLGAARAAVADGERTPVVQAADAILAGG